MSEFTPNEQDETLEKLTEEPVIEVAVDETTTPDSLNDIFWQDLSKKKGDF